MDTTSGSLLVRLREAGQHDAWARFVQLYSPLLHYWARHLGLQKQDAADLVQEVFVVLVKKLPEFDYERKLGFRNWLRTVLLNKWRNFTRRKGLPSAAGVDPEALAAPEDAAFGEVEYRQLLLSRAVQLMRSEFSEKMWKACWEHVAGSRPVAEVARELGISPGTVYVAKARVLARLRQELGPLWD